MRSLVLFAMIMLPAAASPARAQVLPRSGPLTSVGELAPLSAGPGKLSFRINDTVGQDGSRRTRRSIIAGVDVAPNTTLGFGLFDSMPKARGRGPDPRLDSLAKRSRRAAVGMSFRF